VRWCNYSLIFGNNHGTLDKIGGTVKLGISHRVRYVLPIETRHMPSRLLMRDFRRRSRPSKISGKRIGTPGEKGASLVFIQRQTVNKFAFRALVRLSVSNICLRVVVMQSLTSRFHARRALLSGGGDLFAVNNRNILVNKTNTGG
jgi:hypothetical protein